ncbi:hypothetical protein ABZT02_08270 [Streptomyces sp. NPDC005402]|uniref:hypothetical protein n=1 Tax=Streptomyces sp. NPDC005402 TaxID=3155338 RepID=UPI0033BB0476
MSSAVVVGELTGEDTLHPAFVEERFRARTDRVRGWGIGLLGLAALLWGYAAWQLFTPYEVDYGTYGKADCTAPAFADRDDVYVDRDADARRCAAARDWPRPVAALVLAVPLATAGGALLATGLAGDSLRRRESELERARS